MTVDPALVKCLVCQRAESEIPLAAWRYQGRELWICPDCLPRLIHHRAELADQLAAAPPARPEA
ncbi:MAG: hypothetical protein KA764_10660 [Anaerolineales bacterium]|nr:hypothetical protein [Anaerolineales bacterium]